MDKRKQLKEQYRQRTVTGGIYRIENTENGRFILDWDDDLKSIENRFRFAVQFDSCVLPDLAADWKQYGGKAFIYTQVEAVEKKPEQSQKDFTDDLRTLLELYKEKTDMTLAYKK